jgi:hypothetical protein
MPNRMSFRSTVELGGKTATGIEIPADVVAALGWSKRPAVLVTIAGHSYRTTVASMGGRFLVPLNAENRVAAGVTAGEQVDVEIQVDTTPRVVTLPPDLDAALTDEPAARKFFESLSFTHRKEWVRWIEEAKRAPTRTSRIHQTVAALSEQQRTR